MNEVNFWWVIAAFFGLLELVTGTLFAAFTGLGAAIAAVLANVGCSQPHQLLIAVVVSGSLLMARQQQLRRRRHRVPSEDYRQSGMGVLDLGDEILVNAWQPDGTTEVSYGGQQWNARFRGTDVPLAGVHRIAAVETDYLVLESV